MTIKGGTSQACAACKYQRRKCTADCPLAPYFPPDQPKQFQNAHRLFGVSNILKILKQLDPNQKLEAMRSIVYQANIRDKYPVHGCLGIVCSLQFQIHQAQQELHAVNTQLAIFRQHHQISSPLSSQLQLAPATPPNNTLTLFHHQQQQFNVIANEIPMATDHPSFPNDISPDSSSNSNNNNVNQLWSQYSYPVSYNNDSSTIQSQFIPQQPFSCQMQATGASNGYDDISPFFDNTVDDRQSYIDSKEAYESSSESSLKDTTLLMEHVAENQLNNAPTCLQLTSVN